MSPIAYRRFVVGPPPRARNRLNKAVVREGEKLGIIILRLSVFRARILPSRVAQPYSQHEPV
eukprot:2532428-Prymnesium_polylepis.1